MADRKPGRLLWKLRAQLRAEIGSLIACGYEQ